MARSGSEDSGGGSLKRFSSTESSGHLGSSSGGGGSSSPKMPRAGSTGSLERTKSGSNSPSLGRSPLSQVQSAGEADGSTDRSGTFKASLFGFCRSFSAVCRVRLAQERVVSLGEHEAPREFFGSHRAAASLRLLSRLVHAQSPSPRLRAPLWHCRAAHRRRRPRAPHDHVPPRPGRLRSDDVITDGGVRRQGRLRELHGAARVRLVPGVGRHARVLCQREYLRTGRPQRSAVLPQRRHVRHVQGLLL